MTAPVDLDEQRALLVAAADLERMRVGLAWRDVRTAIVPPVDADRRARVRPHVLRAIGYALPLLGYRRMGKTLRVAAVGLAIWRAASAWRASR